MKADFGKILQEAINITFRNKWLWVFGLVLAVTSSSGSGGGGGGSSNNSKKTDGPDKSSRLERVKGIASVFESSPSTGLTTTPQQEMANALEASMWGLFSGINPIYYVILIPSMLLFFALLTCIILYAKSWANASLIDGIYKESDHHFVSLSDSSKKGRAKAVEVLKVTVIPGLILFLIASVLALPVIVIAVLVPVLGVLLAILGVFILILLLILLAVVTALGVFGVVLQDLKWKEALSNGFAVFKKHFLDVLILGTINCFIGCFAGCFTSIIAVLVFGTGIALLAGGALVPPLLIGLLPISILIFLIAIALLTLARAILLVFSQATWVLLYKQLVLSEGTHESK